MQQDIDAGVFVQWLGHRAEVYSVQWVEIPSEKASVPIYDTGFSGDLRT